MATRAAQGRGDAPKAELLGRVRIWKRQLLPVHSKDSTLTTWQWVQTGETAPTLEEHMAKKTRLEPIPDANIVPLPTRPLSERAVQAMRSQSQGGSQVHGSGAVAAAPANSAGTFSTQQAPASALHDLTAGLPRTHSQAPIHPASSVPTLQTASPQSKSGVAPAAEAVASPTAIDASPASQRTLRIKRTISAAAPVAAAPTAAGILSPSATGVDGPPAVAASGPTMSPSKPVFTASAVSAAPQSVAASTAPAASSATPVVFSFSAGPSTAAKPGATSQAATAAKPAPTFSFGAIAPGDTAKKADAAKKSDKPVPKFSFGAK